MECQVCYRELRDEADGAPSAEDWNECWGCGLIVCSACSHPHPHGFCAAGGCLFNAEASLPLSLPPQPETLLLEELDYVETITVESDDE